MLSLCIVPRTHICDGTLAEWVKSWLNMINKKNKKIDVCTQYAEEWRMLFNPVTSKCMIMGRNEFVIEPSWYLKGSLVENVSEMDLLGVTFQCNGTSTAHVDNRISNCRRSFYGLSSSGMCYPGLSSEAKSYIWKTVCSPVLTYGLEYAYLNKTGINKLESLQGRCIKEAFGVSKRSHHSDLFTAMGINTVNNIFNRNLANLWRRIF